MPIPAVIEALAPTLVELFKAINTHLSRLREPDKTEVKKNVDSLQGLSSKLVKVVELSNETSQKLNSYVNFMRYSITAGAKCTQLARVLETLSNDKAKDQLDNFIEMMANLQKYGIEEINEYVQDYKTALNHYGKAETYTNRAKDEIASNRRNSCVNMDNANKELDDLAKLASNGVRELVKELQNAYKALEKPAK